MNREDYQWYKTRGICTRCCHEPAAYGRGTCISCRDKIKLARKGKNKKAKDINYG